MHVLSRGQNCNDAAAQDSCKNLGSLLGAGRNLAIDFVGVELSCSVHDSAGISVIDLGGADVSTAMDRNTELHPLPVAELMRRAAAIRPLARALLNDDDAADEAAHEAWLRRTPGRQLLAALANLLRDRRRTDARRRARERVLAESGEAESPATVDVVANAEIRRDVLDAVVGLGEPLRTAIWLRFFEDQPPRVIAKRTGAPVNTVRSRIRLGLARLRVALDDRYGGDRERWQRSLVPAAGLGAAVGGVTLPGIIVIKKLVIVVAAAMLVFLAVSVAIDLAGPKEQRNEPLAITPAGSAANAENDLPDAIHRTANPAKSGGPFEVAGTVVLEDLATKARLAPGDGELYVRVGRARRVVPIRDGRFSLALARAARVEVAQIRLDSWATMLEYQKWECTREQASVSLAVVAHPRGELAVLDAKSGAHVRGVEIVAVTGVAPELVPVLDLRFPDLFASRLTAGDSPLVMPGTLNQGSYRVRAPGYAWAELEFDHEHGGARFVYLHPGGDLDVNVSKAPRTLRSHLRVRDKDGRCLRDGQLESESATVTGLPVGEYEVAVELGERAAARSERFVLAQASATVSAGDTTRVTLVCAKPDARLSAPSHVLRGTLTVPPSWKRVYVGLLAVPLDRQPLVGEVERTATRRKRWPTGRAEPFELEGLLPGRYLVLAQGIGAQWEVSVPAKPLDLRVPDPVEFRVHTVDRAGAGRHVPLVPLMVRTPDGVDRNLSLSWRSGGDGVAWFRCLPGEHRLRIRGIHEIEKRVRVPAGGGSITLTVPRTYGTLLEFRDGTARVPVDPKSIELRGPGAWHRALAVEFQLSTHTSARGEYELHVQVPGYEPVNKKLFFGDDWRLTVIPLRRAIR